MRHVEIGQAQAWGYPAERAAVLWECVLDDCCCGPDPADDPNLTSVWSGVEHLLVEQIPGLEWIVTPSWEDLYDLESWHAFLRAQGYQPTTRRTFLKELRGHP